MKRLQTILVVALSLSVGLCFGLLTAQHYYDAQLLQRAAVELREQTDRNAELLHLQAEGEHPPNLTERVGGGFF